VATDTPLAQRHQLHGAQPVLPVPDVAAACDWFCRVLGFSVDFSLGEPPQHARVKAGDGSWGEAVYIHLSLASAPVQPCGQTRLHVGHDIDGLHAHALREGAQVAQPPTDQPWGLREIVLLAPGGHRLVLGAEIAHDHAADTAPRPVIACYRALPGQEQATLDLARRYVPTLQRLGLASDRAPLLMQAADGTLVQAFEWRSAQAIHDAHQHPEVLALWDAMRSACKHVPLVQLAEAQQVFAGFSLPAG
jgi:catechol 2,3-dioxygenase-like lactoylglutathione lyase family enzyme